MRRTSRLGLLLAAVALSLTACGSGDSASDTATGGDAPTLVIGGCRDEEVFDERNSLHRGARFDACVRR